MSFFELLRTVLFAGVFSCFAILSVFAHSSGKAGSTAGCTCHGAAPSPDVSIKVTSASGSFSVEPGGILNLRAEVAHTSNNFFGIDIAVKSTPDSNGQSGQGKLSPATTETDLRLSKGELTHNFPKQGKNDSVEFNFIWQAPTVSGSYFLHIAALAANNDGMNNEPDRWNIIEPIRLIVNATGVAETIQAEFYTVYPNPSTDGVSIKIRLETSDYCRFLVTDMRGAIVFASTRQFRTAGEQVFEWKGRNNEGTVVVSGHYTALICLNDKIIRVPIIIQR